jgi:hypothetical protein
MQEKFSPMPDFFVRHGARAAAVLWKGAVAAAGIRHAKARPAALG